MKASFVRTILICFFINKLYAVIEVPKLPTRYSATIEANIIQKNQTWIVEEWYDGTANKAKRTFFYNDIIAVTYEDFSDASDQLWSYSTLHDDTSNAITCTLESYKSNRKRWRNEESKSGNIVSSAEWFEFGGNYSETYLGSDFVIRGISAEGWTRNVSRSMSMGAITMNHSFALTYYFAIPRWDWFKSSEHRIPVRVELTGTRLTDNGTYVTSYDYHHYYDYVQFLAEDLMLSEGLQFDIPDFYEQCNVTAYCSVYDSSHICDVTRGPSLPKLPNSFSAQMEISTYDTAFFEARATFGYDVYYDQESNRAHSVFRFLDGYDENAYHMLELLDESDGGQVWQWMGDGIQSTPATSDDNIRNCNMFGAAIGYTGFQYGLPVSNGTLLSTTREFLFNDNEDPEISSEIWMGYTTVRGIAAEKWKATFNVTIKGGEETIWLPVAPPSNQQVRMYGSMFWYFSSANWSFAYDANDSVIPLAARFVGTYEVYNYSDVSHGYEMVETMELNEYWQIFRWLPGKPDETWFVPPTKWRKYCSVDSAYCDASDHEEHEDEDACDQGLDLPTLPQHKYYAVVEGTDAVNETTSIIKIWYNYDTNEYRNEYYKDDLVVVTYDDLDNDRRWTYVHYVNDSENMLSCNVVPFTTTIEPGNERFAEEYVDTGHVKTAADLWRFGADWNVTYLGDGFSVRGIPAKAWHSVSNTSYAMNGVSYKIFFEQMFYFADDWDYYSAIETADIPLRVDTKGVYDGVNTSQIFDMQFHVVSFFSGPEAFDESEMKDVFDDWYSQCNLTLYCDEYTSADICKGKKKSKKSSDKDKTVAYAVMIPLMFILGLIIGSLITRWMIRKKGVASFKTSMGHGSGL